MMIYSHTAEWGVVRVVAGLKPATTCGGPAKLIVAAPGAPVRLSSKFPVNKIDALSPLTVLVIDVLGVEGIVHPVQHVGLDKS